MVTAFVNDCEVSSPCLILRLQIFLNQHGLTIKKEQIFIFIDYFYTNLIVGCDTERRPVL